MKKSALWLLSVLSCSIYSCQDKGKSDTENLQVSECRHAASGELVAQPPSEMSVYNSQSSWVTQHGESVKLNAFGGKIQVMAMMYSSCQYTCPMILADLKNIESAAADKYGENVRFILVSIDPARDTPEKLKAFAEKNDLNDNWILLNGKEDDILELAAMLGVQYKKISETDFSHSNILTVLNPAGEIIHQQMGLGADVQRTISTITETFAHNHAHHQH